MGEDGVLHLPYFIYFLEKHVVSVPLGLVVDHPHENRQIINIC